MTVRWQARIGFGKRCLRLDRTLNGIDGAAELGQHAVPGSIGNPTATGGNRTIKDVASSGQILEGTDLVGPHEAAVSLDIGRKNRDQPAYGITCAGQDTPSDHPDRLPHVQRREHLEVQVLRRAFRKTTMSALGCGLNRSTQHRR
jgi:hypothetical protein